MSATTALPKTQAKPAPPNVSGWANTAYSFDVDAPSIIVSPEADSHTLMNWAYGQVQQLDLILGVIACSPSDVQFSSANFAAGIRNSLQQVMVVMEEAIDRLPSGRPTDNQVPS